MFKMAPRLTTRVYKSKTFEQTGEGPEVGPAINRPSREENRAPDAG